MLQTVYEFRRANKSTPKVGFVFKHQGISLLSRRKRRMAALSRIKKRQRHQSAQQKTLYHRSSSSEATTPSLQSSEKQEFFKSTRGAPQLLNRRQELRGHQDAADHSCRTLGRYPR
jgi:hypothetical protein